MKTTRSAKALRVSPMIPSSDLRATKEFLIRAVGFETVMDESGYVILTKDNYDLHICPAEGNPNPMSIYLEVDDLDPAWDRLKSEITKDILVREPFTRDYGMREFHSSIPGTSALLFVGERV